MRFYTKQHKYYCGIDLHARSMYICIVDEQGKTVFHRNRKASAEALLKAIEPFREDIVVAVECMFVCTGWLMSAPKRRSLSSSATPST